MDDVSDRVVDPREATESEGSIPSVPAGEAGRSATASGLEIRDHLEITPAIEARPRGRRATWRLYVHTRGRSD
jgi:hypothetical protein